MLGDKGYDSDATRSDLEWHGIDPAIPTKSDRKVQRTTDKATYETRNRIERLLNKIKHSRRVATRYDKLTLPRVRATRNGPILDQFCPHGLTYSFFSVLPSQF
jgi:transposase